MACSYKRIKTIKLCRADLKHLVELQSREIVPSNFDNSSPTEQFTTLRNQWVAIETVRPGLARFAKINIDDRATHIFWAIYDSELPEMENGNNYILHNSKRYKVLKSENVNELNTVIAIQATERGDEALKASEA